MKRLLGLFFLSLLASGCATTGDVTAFKDANDTSNIQESEGRLWHEARSYDTTIERSGQIYEDPRATAYLQGVMDRLYPEFKGKIHVHLYDSTQLNAFALPNGSVYFNIGLLARIGNEAQLAAVLGHEAAHFIEKHSFRQRVSAKNASAFAVSGIPFAQYMHDSLFVPLGMTRSSFGPLPIVPGDLALGHDDSEPPHPVAYDYVQTAPASMMTSTGSDVARFMIAHLQGGTYAGRRMLGTAALQEMHRRQFAQHERLPGVALGFWERFQNGERALWHDGDGAGFASLLYLLPERGAGFFLAFNGSGGGAAREEVLAALLDRFFPDQRPITRPAVIADAEREARRCAGAYAFNRYGHRGIERFVSLTNRVEVRVDSGGTLSFRGNRFAAIAPGLFQRMDGRSFVAFDPGTGGGARRMFTGGGIARVYERVPWYATASVQVPLLGYCILVFLAMLASWPVAALLRRGRQEPTKPAPRPGPRRIAILVSALGVLFVMGLAAGIGFGLEYGVPPWFVAVMVLPIALIGAGLVCVVGCRAVWSDPAASRGWRIGYTLVATAAVAFIAWLAQWDLIGFRF